MASFRVAPGFSFRYALLLLAAPVLASQQTLAAENVITVDTKIGPAYGYQSALADATVFPVRYASAERWQQSVLAVNWTIPNDNADVTVVPLSCPQQDLDSNLYSEDCLSIMLYVPSSLKSTDSVPTMLWIHGGSFIVGSATEPDLDGSVFAANTNTIVAVMQYRLGALGFMPPGSSTNLGVADVVNALEFLQNTVPSFGGDKGKITLFGQSSGAGMIRALLAVPSADSLFRSAILQSDPMNYGFLSTKTQSTLRNSFIETTGCDANNQSCFDSLSIDNILSAQAKLVSQASTLDPAAGLAEPIRPVLDGSLLRSPLDSPDRFPAVNKPILVTTVANESGPTVYSLIPTWLPFLAFGSVVKTMLGNERAKVVSSSPYYKVGWTQDAREEAEVLATDYMWKCPSWTFARSWAKNGGTTYVGVFTVGADHPHNSGVGYCGKDGVVCHEDDIMIVFGTVSNPSEQQKRLIDEVQKRFKAFAETGIPNAGGLSNWDISKDNIQAQNLGGQGPIGAGACVPDFWGEKVKYDYQLYGV